MFTELRRRKAIERVKPGNGRPLKRFRWWQHLNRALFHLTLPDGTYSVDVPHWQQDENGYGRVHLYVDGIHHAESRVPAIFEVPGGVIEVKSSSFGLKRCHYVTYDGTEHQLTPDRDSSEGRRARLDREHPGLSRGIGVVSVVLLIGPLVLLLLQLAESIMGIPPVAERFGTFTSPVNLSAWANSALGLIAAAASTERALRLRYSAILDGS